MQKRKFQSTLPRRERPAPDPDRRLHKNFNPRSHEGSDGRSTRCEHSIKISIHAPTKGATSVLTRLHAHPSFQSTLPRRERPYIPGICLFPLLFQSTLPRRERPNSSNCLLQSATISIHAPTKGATTSLPLKIRRKLFQSTLPRRERRHTCAYLGAFAYFNPRSHEGSDPMLTARI